MKILILGMGHVGKALADRLLADGHTVTGATTTESKCAVLARHASEVRVLRGSDEAAVKQAAAACDAIIVTVAPNVRKTRTREEREEHYRDVLLATCRSAAMTGVRTLFLSSFSVYGDGGENTVLINEQAPSANQEEPSARYYHMAENEVLNAGGVRCDFRICTAPRMI